MDRLTFDGNFCDIAQCLEMRGGKHCPDGYCSQRRVWERLKEYEDTGLAPDEVSEFSSPEVVEIARLLSNMLDDGSAQHMVELFETERDERLVELPCKVGDTLWIIVKKRPKLSMPEFQFIKRSTLTWLNMRRVLQDFGKTVFLTREEAESALEKENNKNDFSD